MHRFFSMRLAHLLLVVVMTILLVESGSSRSDELDLSGSAQMLVELRDQAVSRVRILRALRGDSDIAAADLLRAQVLYSDVRGAMNGWVERVLIDLELNKRPEPTPAYSESFNRAVRLADDFVKEADLLIFGQDRAAIPGEAIANLIGTIAKSAVEIWQSVRAERADERARLVARIEALRWPGLEAID